MLKVTNLNFSFPQHPILNQVNFELADGEIVGLVAPNGTGKTTLLRLLSGLLDARGATITLNGTNANKQRRQYLAQLFFLENSGQLYPNLTVRDHLRYVRGMWQSDVVIEDIVEELEMIDYIDKKVKNLSLGMKQHLLLAMYLVTGANTLLIDEPLNGLDPTSILQFETIFRKLRNDGKTLLVSSHQMDSVGRVCDRVFFLKNQQLHEVVNTGQDFMALYRHMYLGGEGDA